MYREWKARGEYGYWVVYEYHPIEDNNSGAVYSQVRGIPSKRLAIEFADALNRAFRQGAADATEVAISCASESKRKRTTDDTPQTRMI